MANYTTLPSGSVRVRLRVDGEVLSKTFPDKRQADAWVHSIENPVASTIPSLTDSYLKSVMIIDGKRRGAYDSIEHRFSNLSKRFKSDVGKITKGEVERYIKERGKEVSGGTVRLEIQLLSRFLRWCIPQGLVGSDVTKEVILPKPGKPRSKIVTDLEFSRILSYTTDVMKPIFLIGFETAMRRSEILAIRPCMVDAKKSILYLSADLTKNGEERFVPLTSKALAILKEVCDGHDGKVKVFNVKPHSVTRAFKRACNLAGIKGICFHTLRHTCITRYAEMDFNTLQLQCISGHKDIKSLSGYTHVRAEKIAELMNKKT